MKKSSLALIACLLVTLTLAVGGTIAYLTDTDSIVNTFTIGEVDISLLETYQKGATLAPGVDVVKSASIQNDGKNDAYVIMTVSVPAANDQPLVIPTWDATGWTLKANGQSITLNGESYILYAYMYDKALTPAARTNDLLKSIKLDPRVDFNPYTKKFSIIENGTATDTNVDLTAGKVYVNAFAIQTTGFKTLDEAYTAYVQQWGASDGWTQDQIITGAPSEGEGDDTTTLEAKTVEDFKKALTDASASGAGDTVINLAQGEYDMTGWDPATIQGYTGAGVITIYGNHSVLTNMTTPLFAGGFAGESGIIIQDLTIKDSKIVSSNTLGSGAFIETVDSMPTITLNNCHLKNSTLTGSRTGGLIGWNSGYNNTNDGPVQTNVTITNCTVDDCEITGAGTVGGIVGHAGANAWTYNNIKNCSVTNTKLTSNDDSYRVGAIVGTANVGEVVIENCTSTGNTILQNNNGVEITRPEGQSELYGRFVPENGSGKLTIDGVEIN